MKINLMIEKGCCILGCDSVRFADGCLHFTNDRHCQVVHGRSGVGDEYLTDVIDEINRCAIISPDEDIYVIGARKYNDTEPIDWFIEFHVYNERDCVGKLNIFTTGSKS